MKKLSAWVHNKGHLQGIFWIVTSSFLSNLCDVAVRLVSHLPTMQIAFFRFFFGTLILLPILLHNGKSSFSIKNKTWQLLRIVIGFGAFVFWIYGVRQTSLPSITTMSFVCPLLVVSMAYLFLGEKSDWKRQLAVIVGFVGVFVIAFFENGAIDASKVLFFHQGIVFLFLGAALFAMSDILNKKMLASESLVSLLFYFYLGTTIMSLVPALFVWEAVTFKELLYLLMLGTGGASTLYCILKATNSTEISSLTPYKYSELIISIIIGYLVFNEVIKFSTIVGACLIIPSALLIAYHEINKEKRLLQKNFSKENY